MAKRAGRREAELAPELLLRAIEEARRDEVYARAEAAVTPEWTRRTLEVVAELERIRG